MTHLRRLVASLSLVAIITALGAACQPSGESDSAEPHLVGGSDVERGRYLAIIGGCNDCHTDGYLEREGDVPEADWLMGSALGWRGPWGTTYARNLRLTVQGLSEDEWVTTLRTRKTMPPMPWSNVNQLAESDARVLYRYIRSLGSAGEPMPATVPPDQEPTTPYFMLEPVVPER